MAVVYQHIRSDTNEVFYVGIGKSKKRAFSVRDRSRAWQNITAKVSYDVIIVCEGLSWEKAVQQEKRLIRAVGRRDLGLGPLVNMTDGGDGLSNPSPEALERMRKPKSDSHIQNLRKSKSTPSWKKGLRGIRSKEDLLKNKMNQKNRREVRQIDANGNIVKVWLSIRDAVRVFGSGVSCCLAGYQKTCKGYSWSYASGDPPMSRIGGRRSKKA